MATGWGFQALDDPLAEDEWTFGDVGQAPRSNNGPWSTNHGSRHEANGAVDHPVPYSSSPLNFSTPPRHVNAQATRDRLSSPARFATGFASYDAADFPYTINPAAASIRQPYTQSEHSYRRPESEIRPDSTTRRTSGQASPQDPFAELLRRQLQPREAPAQQWGAADSGIDDDPADDSSQLHSIASESEGDMPVTRRHQPTQNTTHNHDGVVDLTQSPTSTPQARTRKRGAESGSGSEPSKRRKESASHRPAVVLDEEDEPEDEAPSADAELVSAQQMDALKQQESGREEGPVKMGKRTCIICLENFTNATVAHCGHIFCHECLIRALMASEKHSERGPGNCPACRKPISRKKGITIIPINFMKASAFNTKGRGRELNV